MVTCALFWMATLPAIEFPIVLINGQAYAIVMVPTPPAIAEPSFNLELPNPHLEVVVGPVSFEQERTVGIEGAREVVVADGVEEGGVAFPTNSLSTNQAQVDASNASSANIQHFMFEQQVFV